MSFKSTIVNLCCPPRRGFERIKKISLLHYYQNILLSPESSGERKPHYNTNIKYLFCLQKGFKENVWEEIENLDKSDKRESHAESEHSSDIGDEGYGRHYLRKSKDSYLLLVIFYTTTIWG